MIQFTLKHPKATHDMLGYLPSFLNENDQRPAREQFNTAYRHGGGWQPFVGFTMTDQGLRYPGDPMQALLAEARLRDEIIRFYNSSWVAVIQKDGSYEVCRMD